ncbi:hypothetical protein [Kitasatospora sp. NPDC008115]|uniref:hypothetical protein n=1 Tax=Kitasatospora sp. NPDC008115 TaxID=3364022 RepID=UPI0036E9F5C8
MTNHHGQGAAVCAGPRCERPLPGPARTGRPGLYCGQACRQAALRRRRLDEQVPQLRAQARDLLEGLGPEPAAAGRHSLEAMDGERLAVVVRHARAVGEHLAALHDVLGLPPRVTGGAAATGAGATAPAARPTARGPRPVPGNLVHLFLEPVAPPARPGA